APGLDDEPLDGENLGLPRQPLREKLLLRLVFLGEYFHLLAMGGELDAVAALANLEGVAVPAQKRQVLIERAPRGLEREELPVEDRADLDALLGRLLELGWENELRQLPVLGDQPRLRRLEPSLAHQQLAFRRQCR